MLGMIRQGDVLCVPVEILKGARLGKLVQSGEVVLAHGEATGHRHRIPIGAKLFELRGVTSGERIAHARKLVAELPSLDHAVPIGILRLDGARELVHEEHSAIPVEGDYVAFRQVEYTPAAIVVVAD